MITILYVDDEPAFLEIGKIYLEETGNYHVDCTTSCKKALNLLTTKKYDVIVSDYHMPDMDGLAFFRAVRAAHGDIPFILFTGKEREEIVIDALSCGVDFYLQRGGDTQAQFAELSHKIRRAVERKRMALQIKANETRFRELVDKLPEMIFEGDSQATITFVNQTGLNVLGYTKNEIESLFNLADLIAPSHRDTFTRMLRTIRTGEGLPRLLECSMLKKNGTEISVEIMANYVVSDEIECYFAFARDITGRKQAETATGLATRKLLIMKDVSRHIIRNKITGLIGCVDMACDSRSSAESLTLTQDIKELIRDIQKQIDFTQKYEEVGVNQPEWQKLREVMTRIDKTGLTFDFDIPDVEIYADPLLGEIFGYLEDNSLRHGVKVTTISLRSTECSDGLVLIYEDNGVGIPTEQKEIIFDKSSARPSGVGLFLVREILTITGITIVENGIPVKGARFEITVPHGGYRRAP